MIDFPSSPTVGQIFISGSQQWMWDGAKWLPNGSILTAVVPMNDNRIINGDMRIDQRNNGASGTAGGYTCDRWQFSATQSNKGTWQRVGTSALAGFPYALIFTSSSAYTVLTADNFVFDQPIEADMISDFAWGTANAQPATLSFWANSSLSGTFGGAIRNDVPNRSYPFSFLLPGGNTWTRVVISIPGDTGGAWVLKGNGLGLHVTFCLGAGATFSGAAGAWVAGDIRGVTGAVSVVGTNGANWVVTGVKLEIGSIATPFNRQSMAQALAACQRYYQTGLILQYAPGTAGANFGSTKAFNTAMRATPTVAVATNNCTNLGTINLFSDQFSVWALAGATVTGQTQMNFVWTANAEL